MIPFLILLWLPASFLGAVLSAVMTHRARQVILVIDRLSEADPVDKQLAQSIYRRESIQSIVMFGFFFVGLLSALNVSGYISDALSPLTPVILTLSSVLLSLGTVVSFFDDRRLRLSLLLERARKERLIDG